jgi:hypothetical protein
VRRSRTARGFRGHFTQLLRAFPADRPNEWQVGYRLGAALGRAFSERDPAQASGTHASARPHIRRAHWHSFLVGKLDEPEARIVMLEWLPPIPVNVETVEDLTTTVRTVGQERSAVFPEPGFVANVVQEDR